MGNIFHRFGIAANAEPWEPENPRVANSGVTGAWELSIKNEESLSDKESDYGISENLELWLGCFMV